MRVDLGRNRKGGENQTESGQQGGPPASVLQVSRGRCPGVSQNWGWRGSGDQMSGGQAQGLTWKAALAQPRKASSWPHSSSPWPSCRSRSPPSSSSRVSTARAKAQKWGYAREPSPNTQNLGAGSCHESPPLSYPARLCPGSLPFQCLPLLRPPDLRVPRAPALSVLLDSFLFRRQEDTSGSEQETLLKRIL